MKRYGLPEIKKKQLDKKQNKQQRGFSENASCINTAFLFTEVLNEAKQNKLPIYAVNLDGRRAFDTVWIESLLRTIYFSNVNIDVWELLNQLYQSATIKVEWEGTASNPFTINQGVRQGGVLSAQLYK